MPIGSSLTFRILLDVVKYVIYFVDGGREIFRTLAQKIAPRGRWHAISLPKVGEAVQIPCGNRNLEAWFVGTSGPTAGSVLLCHGIGDKLTYWRRVQGRLADAGYSSLVFHYSGYGQSGGATTPENLREDALAAWGWLNRSGQGEVPCFLIGFSLGSGLATEVANSLQPTPRALILCEAFPTLREAGRRMGRAFGFLDILLPDVWKTCLTVQTLRMPLLVVHSSGDRLFPVSMAVEIFDSAVLAGRDAELRVLGGYPHNAPYLWVPEDYWAAVLDFMKRVRTDSASG